MTNENRLPMPGLECLWHEGEEVATLKSASAIIKWGDRGWVLRQAFQDECDTLRARVTELEGLLRRALCHPLGDLLEADIISALNLQPKG